MKQTINGADLRRMIISAAAAIENHKQALNELNVFPVPDGDTGTNMSMTITADHGNADQMTETKKGKTSVRTAHSLNPVPFIIYDKDHDWHIKEGHFGLANVAPTIVKMMGLEAPSCWEESMI